MNGGVADNAEENRYELAGEQGTAFVTYVRQGDRITLTHTIVPEEAEGRGVGTRLVKGVLDDVRERGLSVVPSCSFVRHFIDTHEEYRDLVVR